MTFSISSKFTPKGSQPDAIQKLSLGIKQGKNFQTLLGVTGSGKTFTVAHTIAKHKKPTLVIVHNKTLAAQLYEELKELFPENRVEYFVSYYDYYQPESYIPQKDQYIEKDAQINPKIEEMRLAATASLLSRSDTIVVASVSCIYGLGDPSAWIALGFTLKKDQKIERREILEKLVNIQYERNEMELLPGRFRVKGDTLEIIPGYQNTKIRIEMFGDTIEKITEVDRTTGKEIAQLSSFSFFPARHFVIPEENIKRAIESIKKELKSSLSSLPLLEAHRLKQRTLNDIEMIEETGYCKGIENYSRHFEDRNAGERPFCLLDYFPENFLIVIDESHQTIPQINGMYKGDRQRKQTLIEHGFRLNSALDNRPLRFQEFEEIMKKNQVIFVSATPGQYEKDHSFQVVEQIIRPTGLVDPVVNTHPIKGQIENILENIKTTISRNERILLTTLTKKLAEELTDYLAEQGIKTRYLHSDIPTLERSEIIRELRLGTFDVLVGINLLREGLDIPEIGFIGILDADKEGFLRDEKSLIQIIGRAARNVNSTVTLYADNPTKSIKNAITETRRRRELQIDYNKKHGITPETIIKPIREKKVNVTDIKHIPKAEIPNLIIQLTADMHKAADELEFEEAIKIRERIRVFEARISKKSA